MLIIMEEILNELKPETYGKAFGLRLNKANADVNKERKATGGYSSICQHHTKRNAHHWEYWTDFYMGNIVVKTMPYKYACEYVCDMISASRVYNGNKFTRDIPLDYFNARTSHYYMSKATEEFIRYCLTKYKESEWKDLKKEFTKKKYLEITAKLPDVEIIENIKHDYGEKYVN